MNESGRMSAGLVDLVGHGEAAVASSVWPAVVIGLAVAMAAAGLLLGVRWFNGRDPSARAFAQLATRMRLSRRERQQLQVLAKESDVQPVALLVCPSALREVMKHEDPAVRALALKLVR